MIAVSNLPSSTTRQPSSFRSPSTPPIIPYLPASIETSVEKIKREKSRRFKYISDTNSVVTDLADSPWTAWDDEKLRAPSIDPMHDEMERIHNWASSLSIQEETIPDTNSPN